MFERIKPLLDPKKISENFSYIKPLFAVAAFTIAYTAGFLSRIEPGVLLLLGASQVADITFQLFLHLSIAGLVFYAASLVIGVLNHLFSDLYAQHQSSKRTKRFPKSFKIIKLQYAYQRLIMNKFAEQRTLLFAIKFLLASLVFFQIHFAGDVVFVTSTVILWIFITGIVISVENRMKQSTISSVIVSAVISFVVMSYFLGLSRYDHLATTGCVNIDVGGEEILGSIVLSSSDWYFVVENGSENISVYSGSQISKVTGQSYHDPIEERYYVAFAPNGIPFKRKPCPKP